MTKFVQYDDYKANKWQLNWEYLYILGRDPEYMFSTKLGMQLKTYYML